MSETTSVVPWKSNKELKDDGHSIINVSKEVSNLSIYDECLRTRATFILGDLFCFRSSKNFILMIITKGNFDTIAMEACCTMSKSVIVVFWVSLDTREREQRSCCADSLRTEQSSYSDPLIGD